jgi:hypothetical protein
MRASLIGTSTIVCVLLASGTCLQFTSTNLLSQLSCSASLTTLKSALYEGFETILYFYSRSF